MEDKIEQEGVEVCHADEAKNGNDNTYKLYFVVFWYTAEELVGNLAVENY